MTEEGIRISCEYFLPTVREKRSPLFCSFFLDMTFPFHSSVLNVKGSGCLTQQFCSRLLAACTESCQHGLASATLASSFAHAVPPCSQENREWLLPDSLGDNADFLRVNSTVPEGCISWLEGLFFNIIFFGIH